MLRFSFAYRTQGVLWLFLLGCVPTVLHAQVLHWTGSTRDGNWHTAANWDPPQVPVDTNRIAFDRADMGALTVPDNVRVKSITLDQSGFTLDLSGLLISSVLIWRQGTIQNGTLQVDGSASIENHVVRLVKTQLNINGALSVITSGNQTSLSIADGGLFVVWNGSLTLAGDKTDIVTDFSATQPAQITLHSPIYKTIGGTSEIRGSITSTGINSRVDKGLLRIGLAAGSSMAGNITTYPDNSMEVINESGTTLPMYARLGHANNYTGTLRVAGNAPFDLGDGGEITGKTVVETDLVNAGNVMHGALITTGTKPVTISSNHTKGIIVSSFNLKNTTIQARNITAGGGIQGEDVTLTRVGNVTGSVLNLLGTNPSSFNRVTINDFETAKIRNLNIKGALTLNRTKTIIGTDASPYVFNWTAGDITLNESPLIREFGKWNVTANARIIKADPPATPNPSYVQGTTYSFNTGGGAIEIQPQVRFSDNAVTGVLQIEGGGTVKMLDFLSNPTNSGTWPALSGIGFLELPAGLNTHVRLVSDQNKPGKLIVKGDVNQPVATEFYIGGADVGTGYTQFGATGRFPMPQWFSVYKTRNGFDPAIGTSFHLITSPNLYDLPTLSDLEASVFSHNINYLAPGKTWRWAYEPDGFHLNVVANPNPPIAQDRTVSIPYNGQVFFTGDLDLLKGVTDPDGDYVYLHGIQNETHEAHNTSVWSVQSEKGGTITFSPQGYRATEVSVSYVPASGFTGEDTFTYTVSDYGNLTTRTVHVQVAGFTPVYWTGAAHDGDWNNGENWSHHAIPDESHEVWIDETRVTGAKSMIVMPNASVTLGRLHVRGAQLPLDLRGSISAHRIEIENGRFFNTDPENTYASLFVMSDSLIWRGESQIKNVSVSVNAALVLDDGAQLRCEDASLAIGQQLVMGRVRGDARIMTKSCDVTGYDLVGVPEVQLNALQNPVQILQEPAAPTSQVMIFQLQKRGVSSARIEGKLTIEYGAKLEDGVTDLDMRWAGAHELGTSYSNAGFELGANAILNLWASDSTTVSMQLGFHGGQKVTLNGGLFKTLHTVFPPEGPAWLQLNQTQLMLTQLSLGNFYALSSHSFQKLEIGTDALLRVEDDRDVFIGELLLHGTIGASSQNCGTSFEVGTANIEGGKILNSSCENGNIPFLVTNGGVWQNASMSSTNMTVCGALTLQDGFRMNDLAEFFHASQNSVVQNLSAPERVRAFTCAATGDLAWKSGDIQVTDGKFYVQSGGIFRAEGNGTFIGRGQRRNEAYTMLDLNTLFTRTSDGTTTFEIPVVHHGKSFLTEPRGRINFRKTLGSTEGASVLTLEGNGTFDVSQTAGFSELGKTDWLLHPYFQSPTEKTLTLIGNLPPVTIQTRIMTSGIAEETYLPEINVEGHFDLSSQINIAPPGAALGFKMGGYLVHYTSTTGDPEALSLDLPTAPEGLYWDTRVLPDGIQLELLRTENQAPVANPDAYELNEDTILAVPAIASGASSLNGLLFNDLDPDGEAVTVLRHSEPQHGILQLQADGRFSYTPKPNFSGTDAFTYSVTDGHTENSASNEATVTLTVRPVNDPPTASDDRYNTPEDQPLTIAAKGVLANDTDADGDALTARLEQTTQHGTLELKSDGSFVYTPQPNFFGADSFTYRVSDGMAQSDNLGVVNIQVEAVNDAPVARNDAYTVKEDEILTINDGVLMNDADVENDALTVTITQQPANGTLSMKPNGAFQFTPNPNFNGTDGFRYRASDGTLTSGEANVTITIQPVNDAPVARDDAYSVQSGQVLNLLPKGVLSNDLDVEGDALTASLVTDVTSGNLALSADGSLKFTPADRFIGMVTFTYRALDGQLASVPATVTISVTARPNDPPIASDDRYNTPEDQPLTIAAKGVLANDTDADGDALTARLEQTTQHGTLELKSDGSFVYTPQPNFFGADSFTYRVSDGMAQSDNLGVVNIQVEAVNDAPVARNDAYTTPFETTLSVPSKGVLGNDSDAEGDALTAVLVQAPDKGSLEFNADGSFRYVPQAGFSGSDTFTYRAADATAFSALSTVTITVQASLNQSPVAQADVYRVDAGQALNTPAASGILANDTDPDHDPLTAQLQQTTAKGILNLKPDGSFQYTPQSGFFGLDLFTYRATDGKAFSVSTTVTIEVNAVPIARDDAAQTLAGASVSIPILQNDADPDDGLLPSSVQIIAQPKSGQVQAATSGMVTYTPQSGFTGTDGFTYTVTDTHGAASNVASVQITVIPSNRPPVAMPDHAVTNMNLMVSIAVLANDTDPDGDALTVISVSVPANGSATIQSGQSILYTPKRGFVNQQDQFTYTLSDGHGATAQAQVTVQVDPIRYIITELTTLNGTSKAFSLNDAGDVVGISLDSADESRPVLWKKGNPVTLSPNIGQALGVNENGDVTGLLRTAQGDQAFRYQNNQMMMLGDLGGGFSAGYGISEQGMVVGVSLTDQFRLHAFGYTNTLLDRHTFGVNAESEAWDVNLRGDVAGLHYDDTGAHAYINTTVLNGLAESRAYRLNNLGQVAGSVQSGLGVVAMRIQNGTMAALNTLAGNFAEAYGINDEGWVVGASTYALGKTETPHSLFDLERTRFELPEMTTETMPEQVRPSRFRRSASAITAIETHAVLWMGTDAFDLNNLIPSNSGWVLKEARDINNKGQIVGYGLLNGQPRAFFLNPTSNAAPLAMPDALMLTESDRVNVLLNDADADGDALRLLTVYDGTYGHVDWTPDGEIRYTPYLSSFKGTDRLLYVVGDGVGGSHYATLQVNAVTVANEDDALPAETELSPNYPNPFSLSTHIAFRLALATTVEVRVYDVLGREVWAWAKNGQYLAAGTYVVPFDGQYLAGGQYFIHLQTQHKPYTRSMTHLK